jgi:hypothetical protein
MKVYLILNNDNNNIIQVDSVEYIPKSNVNIRPLGDTQSLLSLTFNLKNYLEFREQYDGNKEISFENLVPSGIWKKDLSVVVIMEDDKLIFINYYGSFLSEITTSIESEFVDVEIRADYHEVNSDYDKNLLSLFKAFEREQKLNELGI